MSARRFSAEVRSPGCPPRWSQICTATLPRARAPQTARSSARGSGVRTNSCASRMVITCPATAPQRSRTIQRRLMRAADSTLVSAGMSRLRRAPSRACYVALPVDALQRAIGVTRVARVTGLDRSGVEVACAVRPLGYVLQVCNGKGETWEDARASALSEAAELYAAENPRELVYGAARDLPQAWEPADLVAPRLWSRETRVAWRRGRELSTGREVLVPAQAVHCPPRGAAGLGPAAIRWTTNGMGAHPTRSRALRHALLEAIERDQLASVLPRGWTAGAVAARKLEVSRLPLWRKLHDANLVAHVFDLSGVLPVAGAVLVDLEDGPGP